MRDGPWTMDGEVVLVAEDNENDRRLLQLALEESGYTVTPMFVPDGESLVTTLLRRVEEADAAWPTLVLLDLNMPRLDGRQALQMIRSHPTLRRLPVVVFSTSSSPSDIESCYERGANSYVVKPFDFESMVVVVKRLFDYWFGCAERPKSCDGTAGGPGSESQR